MLNFSEKVSKYITTYFSLYDISYLLKKPTLNLSNLNEINIDDNDFKEIFKIIKLFYY